MEGVDYWDDSQRDNIVVFDDFMEDDTMVVAANGDPKVISPKLVRQSEEDGVIFPNVDREAQSFLAGAGAVGGHLDQEIKREDSRVEQTTHDIHRLMNQAARLRTIKRQAPERYQAPDAVIIIQVVGDNLFHLESLIGLMEAKNEIMEVNVAIARQCQSALDKYENNLPGIPKDD